jgi:hypothetical protein
MALSASDIEQLIAEHGPYLYHGTVEHCVPLILEQGLEPGWSADERTTHVFLGGEGAASTWAQLRGAGEIPQIRVDLRELEPALIDVDPDFWIGVADHAGAPYLIEDGYLALDDDGTPLRSADSDRFPAGPPRWSAADLYFLAAPSPADQTIASFDETGCVAYRGQVPAHAVSLNPAYKVELVRQGKPIPAPLPTQAQLSTPDSPLEL